MYLIIIKYLYDFAEFWLYAMLVLPLLHLVLYMFPTLCICHYVNSFTCPYREFNILLCLILFLIIA